MPTRTSSSRRASMPRSRSNSYNRSHRSHRSCSRSPCSRSPCSRSSSRRRSLRKHNPCNHTACSRNPHRLLRPSSTAPGCCGWALSAHASSTRLLCATARGAMRRNDGRQRTAYRRQPMPRSASTQQPTRELAAARPSCPGRNMRAIEKFVGRVKG